MNILVVGSGGREHALVWKISQSLKVDKIYCAPGNAGISQIAQCVDISVDDINSLTDFALKNSIDMTIVGPELPLVMGITDEFTKKGLNIFGPDKMCAQFEGSKAFTKEFLKKYNIPTAEYREYTDYKKAMDEISDFGLPVVIKADGLAAGKGVIIAQNSIEAQDALKDIMLSKNFGEAGDKVVIEEFLEGTEASVLCFVDGKSIIPMESAQDYKRIFDGDMGGNTGGMGTYSPNRLFDNELNTVIRETILNPIINGFLCEGFDYKGILFVGLMIKHGLPKVLEFNVRFGDPETQSVLMRLKTDIIEIFDSVIQGNLDKQEIIWNDKQAVCVVLASGGYPQDYQKNKVITGLEKISESVVFHAGTTIKDNQVVTNGGRVLGITSVGDTLEEARIKIYEDINKINFDGMQYRRDIAK